jgi:hypothetical protein
VAVAGTVVLVGAVVGVFGCGVGVSAFWAITRNWGVRNGKNVIAKITKRVTKKTNFTQIALFIRRFLLTLKNNVEKIMLGYAEIKQRIARK